MMVEVLNPTLYAGLVRRYGADGVEIIAPGERIEWTARRARPGESDSEWVREVTHSGEEYRLRCPFCKDHRARLYVNHRFGIWDERAQSWNLWLAQCFNEHCFSDYDSQEFFWDDAYRIPVARRRSVRIREGKAVPGRIQEVAPPGPMWRLDELAKTQPNHHAVTYLAERQLDPVQIGKTWGTAYCPRAHVYNMASDRIIIPIHWNGVMVGWQARYIGDDVRGVPFNVAGVPKYWSSPGFRRSQVAYNFHRAVQHPTTIIVEGMIDVWSMGVQSMAVFGKTMGASLRRELLVKMAERHDPAEAVVVLLLDPKKDKKDKVHHIEKLYGQLANQGAPVQVLKVYLPEEMDPGSSDRQWLREYIKGKAAEAGMPVSFRKPRNERAKKANSQG